MLKALWISFAGEEIFRRNESERLWRRFRTALQNRKEGRLWRSGLADRTNGNPFLLGHDKVSQNGDDAWKQIRFLYLLMNFRPNGSTLFRIYQSLCLRRKSLRVGLLGWIFLGELWFMSV